MVVRDGDRGSRGSSHAYFDDPLVTALGVLPLAIGMSEPGREIEGPMAVVILGGLLSSLALNLLILPTLALQYGRFEPFYTRDEFDQPMRNGAPYNSFRLNDDQAPQSQRQKSRV